MMLMLKYHGISLVVLVDPGLMLTATIFQLNRELCSCDCECVSSSTLGRFLHTHSQNVCNLLFQHCDLISDISMGSVYLSVSRQFIILFVIIRWYCMPI